MEKLKLIIYGAGNTGKIACSCLGYNRVIRFAVSYNVIEELVMGKKVISYEEMIEIYKNDSRCIIVVASEKYYIEMEKRIIDDQIERYFVFHENDDFKMREVLPCIDLYKKRVWKSYTEVLSNYSLKKYKTIGIYGENEYIYYLILEIMAQAPQAEIVIMSEDKRDSVLGCKKINFEEGIKNIDCLVLNVRNCESPIRESLVKYPTIDLVDLYNVDNFEKAFKHPELKKYKDLYSGKRIFLIGNGPSLKVEDLNKLYMNGEISMGFNRIYKIFNQTKWRPDFIGMTDPNTIIGVEEDLLKNITVFEGDNNIHCENSKIITHAEIFHLKIDNYYPNYPAFSSDITEGTYRGASVIYDIGLQFAAYMGFTEIYLLGVDHCIKGNVTDSMNHFCDHYYTEDDKDRYLRKKLFFPKEESTKAFEKAEIFSREHGFRIYNATRGGELEVFERVDFDRLFDV